MLLNSFIQGPCFKLKYDSNQISVTASSTLIGKKPRDALLYSNSSWSPSQNNASMLSVFVQNFGIDSNIHKVSFNITNIHKVLIQLLTLEGCNEYSKVNIVLFLHIFFCYSLNKLCMGKKKIHLIKIWHPPHEY